MPKSKDHPPTRPAQQSLPTGSKEQRQGYVLEVGFSGPLPPPQILSGYEAVSPGAAHRIIEQAEQQGVHRRRMEERALDAQIEGMRREFDEARLGQIFAFCVSVLFSAGGAYLIAQGNSVSGTIFGGLGLSGIVATFIRGRNASSHEQQRTNDIQAKKLRESSRIEMCTADNMRQRTSSSLLRYGGFSLATSLS